MTLTSIVRPGAWCLSAWTVHALSIYNFMAFRLVRQSSAISKRNKHNRQRLQQRRQQPERWSAFKNFERQRTYCAWVIIITVISLVWYFLRHQDCLVQTASPCFVFCMLHVDACVAVCLTHYISGWALHSSRHPLYSWIFSLKRFNVCCAFGCAVHTARI